MLLVRFINHPKAGVGRLHLKSPVRLNTPMFADIQKDKMKLRFGIGRSFASLKKSGNLNHYVQFSPKFEKIGSEMMEHVRKSISLNRNVYNQRSDTYFNQISRIAQSVP